MRILSVALIVFLTMSTVFDWDPGPMPGLSVKNALLYLLATALLFQYAVERRFVLQLPAITWLFVALIGYAVLSYVAVVMAIQYPRYEVLYNAFALKNRHVDQLIFFLVFFYGMRASKDAQFTLKCLLIAWAVSHAVALLDAVGLMQVGDIERREDGRVQGAVGESNQYGAFVALSLPAFVAAAAAARGLWRVGWGLAALMTAATLVMTVSRGAFVAVIVATFAGAFLFRRYLSAARIAAWAAGVGVAAVAVFVLVGLSYGDLLYERIVGGASSDLGAVSSSRTEIWSKALATMWEHPITLLTGFGWNAYWSMPFRYSPHNYYLSQWFNLGLPGLICSVLLLVLPVRVARAAFASAAPWLRPTLAAFAIGTIAFAAATFFVDLYLPWLYYWAYAGLVLRMAVNAREAAGRPMPQAAAARARRADPYGWVGAVRQ